MISEATFNALIFHCFEQCKFLNIKRAVIYIYDSYGGSDLFYHQIEAILQLGTAQCCKVVEETQVDLTYDRLVNFTYFVF
jgi:hypothetical protein